SPASTARGANDRSPARPAARRSRLRSRSVGSRASRPSRRARRAPPSAGRPGARSPRSGPSAVLDLQAELGPALADGAVKGVLVRPGGILVQRAREAVAHVRQRLSRGLDHVDPVAVCLFPVLAVSALVGAELLAALGEQLALVFDEEVELAPDHVAERVA